MSVDRLAEGYEPRFDIDAAVGRQGELFCRDIAKGIQDGSIEVKTDERARATGRIYVEHACLRRGEWCPSGIATTEAEFWAYVLGGFVLVAVPVAAMREAHRRAMAAGRWAECSRGSHPTKGALIDLGVLIPWCLEAA